MKYFYVGYVDGNAIECGNNVTRLRLKLLRYVEAKEIKIHVYKMYSGNTLMLPCAIRYVRGGEL